MPKWWKVGFASVFLLTVMALATHLAMTEKTVEAVGKSVNNTLKWNWGPDEKPCKIYDECRFLEVFDSSSCGKQISIDFAIEDAKEQLVATIPLVVISPRQSGPTLIEIGVNRNDFEYFVIGDLRCSASTPTVEGAL